MPTFTTIALENLLDRDSSNLTKTHQLSGSTKTSVSKRSDFDTSDGRNSEKDEVFSVPSKHIYISPALYTTPAPEPIPEGSSEYSPSPSPYIVNHKRRGGFGGGGGDGGRRIKGDLGFEEGKNVIGEKVLGVEVGNESILGVENGSFGNLGGDGGRRVKGELGFGEGNDVIGENVFGVEVGNDGILGVENEIFGNLDRVGGDRGRRIKGDLGFRERKEVIGENGLGVEVGNEGILRVENGIFGNLDRVGGDGGSGIEKGGEREGLGLEEEIEVIGENILGVEVENEKILGVDNGIFQNWDPIGDSKFEMDCVGSVNEGGKSVKGVESHSFVSAQGEFFDAIEGNME